MYTKDDIETHSDGFGRKSHPAVNVKVHNLYYLVNDVMTEFNCDESQAEKACQFAFDSACEVFWQDIQDTAKEILGNCRVYQEGRSGGWLVVYDLPEIESWNAVMLAKWRKFENTVKAEVKYQTGKESMLDSIRANRWAESGAEAYNFIDSGSGEALCLVDLKNQAAQALPDGLKVTGIARSD